MFDAYQSLSNSVQYHFLRGNSWKKKGIKTNKVIANTLQQGKLICLMSPTSIMTNTFSATFVLLKRKVQNLIEKQNITLYIYKFAALPNKVH